MIETISRPHLGILLLDTQIQADFMEGGSREIYTLNDHFLAYKKKSIKIIRLVERTTDG